MTFARVPDGTMFANGVPDDYQGGSIQRVDPTTGAWQTLYETCDGRRLTGPNDIVFARTGGFWFTDMGKAGGDTSHRGALSYADRASGVEGKSVCVGVDLGGRRHSK